MGARIGSERRRRGTEVRASPGHRNGERQHRPATPRSRLFADRRTSCACGGGCPRCTNSGPVPQTAGRPLDADLRARFESTLAADFSRVRVHSGGAATKAADRLDARAFTLGHDMVFRAGEYRPGTATGDWLIGHELAHVAQFRPGGASDSIAGIESDARHSATAALLGLPAAPKRRHDGTRVHRFGSPENVPDRAYISNQGTAGFLNQAVAYHRAWGIRLTRVGSLEEIVTSLAARPGHIGRIRIVSHAAAIGLLLSLLRNQPSVSLTSSRLTAWATSDLAGLRHDLGYPFGQLSAGQRAMILAHLRRRHAASLAPFGIRTIGRPTGALVELFQRVTDLSLLQQVRTPQNAGVVDPMITATGTILADIRTRVMAQGRINATAVLALQVAIRGAGFRPAAFVPSPGLGSTLRAANRAVGGNFRVDLDRARQRLNANSWIDIRGCNIGRNRANLVALQRFFSRGRVRPHVSAPEWFQQFLHFGYQPLANDAAIDAAFSNHGFAASLAHWSRITGIRSEIQALRFFYTAALFQRRQANRARGMNLGLGGLSGSRRIGPFPRLSLGVGPLAVPVLPLPAIPQVSNPADRVLVRMIMMRGLDSLSLRTQRSPSRLRLSPILTLQDPLELLIRSALHRLNLPTGEARYYFNSPHVLPVFRPGGFRFYYLNRLREPAFDRWLDSQWTTAPRRLQVIKQQAATGIDSRRIQAITPLRHGGLSRMLFPPDPDYWRHIIRI